MSTSKIYSDHTIDLAVPLGRLIYQGAAAKGLELAYDEQAKTWLQRRPGEQGPGRVTTLLQSMRASTALRRWVVPAAVSLALGTLGAAGVWYALHDGTPAVAPPQAGLPPPLPEPDGLVETVAAPYALPVARPETAASAVREDPIGIEPETASPSTATKPLVPKAALPKLNPTVEAVAQAKPTLPVPTNASAPDPKVETRQPKPVEAKPSAQGTSNVAQSEAEVADSPIFDAGSTSARSAAPIERNKRSVTAAAAPPAGSAAMSSKALLAVPTRDWIVATDPSNNLPRRYKIGETLPSGARIISADPSTGVVTTDRGNLRLE